MTIERAGLRVSGISRDAALRARSTKLMGGALARLARYRERERDNKRHPKKYFASRRAVAR